MWGEERYKDKDIKEKETPQRKEEKDLLSSEMSSHFTLRAEECD